MADTVTWVGATALQLQMPIWRFTAEGTSLTLTYEGPINTCHAERPANGGTVDGFTDYGLKVTSAEIEEIGGGAGRMTVQLDSPTDPDGGGGGGGSNEPIGDPIYELNWFPHGFGIEEHPRCGRLKNSRPYYTPDGTEGTASNGKQRTWEDWADLDADDYDSSFSRGPGHPDIWTLAQFKTIRELGVDSFEMHVPAVTKTTYYLRSPGGFGAALNKQQNPPPEAGAPTTGWKYRKTDDSLEREGRLRARKESWLGATWLPPLLFETA
jgi:hypothetical protein